MTDWVESMLESEWIPAMAAAQWARVGYQTLAELRYGRHGPPFRKVGGRYFYNAFALELWAAVYHEKRATRSAERMRRKKAEERRQRLLHQVERPTKEEYEERRVSIYWAWKRGTTFTALAKQHGLSIQRVRQLCTKESLRLHARQLKQERAWLLASGLSFLQGALCDGAPPYVSPIDSLTGCRSVPTNPRIQIRLLDPLSHWKGL